MATTTSASISFIMLTLTLATMAQNLTEDCIGQEGGQTTISGSISLGFGIIFAGVESAVANDPRMATSLLRLHFHDCFVNASIHVKYPMDAMLQYCWMITPNFIGEKTAGPNSNSLGGSKSTIRSNPSSNRLDQTPSLAPIFLQLQSDSGALSGGGLTWQVETGRKDRLTASCDAANRSIPAPTSDMATLTQKFQNGGLSQKDTVALSGVHTIGKARCTTFTSHLSGSNGGNRVFLSSLHQLCLTGSSSTLDHLDLTTPTTFDNQYYINLLSGEDHLPSDQVLANDNALSSLVENYASDLVAFFEDFRDSMVRMGRLAPKEAGEIWRCCRVVN